VRQLSRVSARRRDGGHSSATEEARRREMERIDLVGARRTYSLARPPWGPASWGPAYCGHGARGGYGSSYTTAHGRTLRKRISRCPNQGYDWLTQLVLVVTRHRRVRIATRAAAGRVCAYDFLSPDMLRNEGGASSHPASSVWFRILDAARRRVSA